MQSSSVLPSRWTEVLNRMQEAVKKCLAIEVPLRHPDSPPSTTLPTSLPNASCFDASVKRAAESAAKADDDLQAAADDLYHWLVAYQKTGQKLAAHLQRKVE
jgi:hypothetical protein